MLGKTRNTNHVDCVDKSQDILCQESNLENSNEQSAQQEDVAHPEEKEELADLHSTREQSR
jgi:hypothetical protein